MRALDSRGRVAGEEPATFRRTCDRVNRHRATGTARGIAKSRGGFRAKKKIGAPTPTFLISMEAVGSVSLTG